MSLLETSDPGLLRPFITDSDVLASETLVPPPSLQRLLDGQIACVEYANGQVLVDAPRRNRVLLPGSFNPLHDGHKQLLHAACAAYTRAAAGSARLPVSQMEGCFELSVGNADKGFLPLPEVERRVAQFLEADLPVVVTSAPLFTQKARLFTESAFAVGYDTAIRMVMTKYYNDSFTDMILQFDQLRQRGCRLVVGGRKEDSTGQFKGFQDVDVPVQLQDLFIGIPETDFRMDISSSEIRNRLPIGAGTG